MFNALALEARLSIDNCCLIGWNQKNPTGILVRINIFIQTGIPAVNDTLELSATGPTHRNPGPPGSR